MANIIYFSDPMCSWCWGFSPTIEQLREEYGNQYDFTLIMGGLRPGETKPMDDATKQMVEHHWEEVNRRTGQPFDHEFFQREGFVYNTEPACRAVVTARELHEGHEFAFLKAVHHAFYAQNKDTGEAATYQELAEGFGWDGKAFVEAWDSDAMKLKTQEDFTFAAQLGVRGFPTTVLEQNDKLKLLSPGWRNYEGIKERLEQAAAIIS